MLDVYNWPTSNGRKIFIMLEECGLPYKVHPVSIRNGEQFKPEFLKFSPNNKIPALIDQDGPRWQADLAVRVGRHPDVSRAEVRQVFSHRHARPI